MKNKDLTLVIRAKSVKKIDEVYKILEKIDNIEIYILMELSTRNEYEVLKDTGAHYEKVN